MKEGESNHQESLEKAKVLAAQLARWDNRIVEITVAKEPSSEAPGLELVCSFDPEPASDTTGFFWIVNLLARIDFEGLDERLEIQNPIDLGFRIGEQVFLPNGEILRAAEDQPVLWPEHE